MGSDCLSEEAAVDAEVRAGDEAAGFVAGQKNGRADEFGGFAESAHWRVGHCGVSTRGGRAVRIEKDAAVLFGWKKAGRDRINAHAFGGPFASEKLREAEDSRFGR